MFKEEIVDKRVSARAIIFLGDNIVSMYREKNGRIFYTFPGGGIEENETEEDCVKREVFEEFGLIVKPIKKVYIYENERSLEHFFICQWLAGEVGSGAGEEFQEDRNKGVYKQTTIEISKIKSLPLMPPEVAERFLIDFNENGKDLRKDILKIDGSYK